MYFLLFLSFLQLFESHKSKFCVNCKYFMQNKYVSDTLFGQCLFNPTKLDKVFDLISGELIEDNSEYAYCVTARQFEYLCGVSGKNYILSDMKNKMQSNTDQ